MLNMAKRTSKFQFR